MLCTLPAAAGSEAGNRALTPAERTVVDRFARIVGAVLDDFRSDDWNESIEYTLDDATTPVKPETPLQAGLLQRSYHARPGSARWNALIAPNVKALLDASDVGAAGKARHSIRGLLDVHVSATFNTAFSEIDPAPPGNPDLRIAGTAAGFRVEHPSAYEESGVVLLFGDWKSALWDAENSGYRYKFSQAPGSPVIENVEIRFGGAADRVDELLQRIDWRRVDAALGP